MTQPDVRRPYLPLYVKDFLADEAVQLMDLDGVGAYVLLLMHQWWHGSVPAGIPELARLCKNVTPARMRRLWQIIGPKFYPHPDTPDRLVNRKMEAVRADQEAYRQVKSKAGRKGAAKKWKGHTKKGGKRDGKAMAEHMAEPVANTWPPTPSKAYGVGKSVEGAPAAVPFGAAGDARPVGEAASRVARTLGLMP